MTELKNLTSTCEFGDLYDGLLIYEIVDGIQADKIRDVLLRKGAGMTLENAIETNRTEGVTRRQKELSKNGKDVGIVKGRSRKQASNGMKSVARI